MMVFVIIVNALLLMMVLVDAILLINVLVNTFASGDGSGECIITDDDDGSG